MTTPAAEQRPDAIKEMVRRKYAEIALQDKATNESSCCGSGGCSTEVATIMSDDYERLKGYNPDADLGLGCGLPTEFADMREGDTVLDLGSGAGNDCFVARAAVGEDGRVIGVDFTPEMIEKARANAAKLGLFNVEFRQGDIEQLPVGPDRVDVVVSNCVLNLVPDKKKALCEISRVLKPGGHFSISDIVIQGTLPNAVRDAATFYAGCVSGALQETEYLGLIHSTGFTEVTVQRRKRITIPEDILSQHLSADQVAEFQASDVGIYSITVRGTKKVEACCAPIAEGTEKIKQDTGEACGCGVDNACC